MLCDTYLANVDGMLRVVPTKPPVTRWEPRSWPYIYPPVPKLHQTVLNFGQRPLRQPRLQQTSSLLRLPYEILDMIVKLAAFTPFVTRPRSASHKADYTVREFSTRHICLACPYYDPSTLIQVCYQLWLLARPLSFRSIYLDVEFDRNGNVHLSSLYSKVLASPKSFWKYCRSVHVRGYINTTRTQPSRQIIDVAAFIRITFGSIKCLSFRWCMTNDCPQEFSLMCSEMKSMRHLSLDCDEDFFNFLQYEALIVASRRIEYLTLENMEDTVLDELMSLTQSQSKWLTRLNISDPPYCSNPLLPYESIDLPNLQILHTDIRSGKWVAARWKYIAWELVSGCGPKTNTLMLDMHSTSIFEFDQRDGRSFRYILDQLAIHRPALRTLELIQPFHRELDHRRLADLVQLHEAPSSYARSSINNSLMTLENPYHVLEDIANHATELGITFRYPKPYFTDEELARVKETVEELSNQETR
ncbi:hypothetical protein BT63DRAFT_439729 [Microthyrium microscopicum]|uniref:Uncharacterized protein n=1 Tax=Microthyrium microscopicum TaxID=703497 RepID=A0A6A6UCZ2_9PEZI|nr:hypothetical protein BT63DRAFT_439729 [Microthyrium microscopicum]